MVKKLDVFLFLITGVIWVIAGIGAIVNQGDVQHGVLCFCLALVFFTVAGCHIEVEE